jgi:osmotically-inducible protein OsmY
MCAQGRPGLIPLIRSESLQERCMKTNSQLQQDVLEQLQWLPSVRNAEIGVAVKDGVVTLTGAVDSYAQKFLAEKTAKGVVGVRAVAEELKVKLPFTSQKSDTDIAHSAVSALKWNSEVPSEQIKVKVENGWLTLTGDVDWQFQKMAAEEAVRYLTGMKGMINGICVSQKKVSAYEVSQKIKDALKRSATVEGDRISVESKDGKVTLTGTVRSWSERLDAEDAAWAAPGVFVVEDKIAVGA